eukprot:12923365-Prorocentrum_lima.AAC.1
MLHSSATIAEVAETSCINWGMKLFTVFRVPQNMYTTLLAPTNGAMPTNHEQIAHIKVLLVDRVDCWNKA